jgi:hypothetical protein
LHDNTGAVLFQGRIVDPRAWRASGRRPRAYLSYKIFDLPSNQNRRPATKDEFGCAQPSSLRFAESENAARAIAGE